VEVNFVECKVKCAIIVPFEGSIFVLEKKVTAVEGYSFIDKADSKVPFPNNVAKARHLVVH